MDDARRTQRIGAYAVVLRGGSLLLTRISPVGYPVGSWNLPGGGVDHGESPHDTVVRELHEETGLAALSSRLIDVASTHVVEVGRDDAYEDYHGIGLLYAVTVDESREAKVTEIGGTTDLVQWVSLDDVGSPGFPVINIVRHAIGHLDDYRPGGAAGYFGAGE